MMKKLVDEYICNEVKLTPEAIVNAKVVSAMKKLLSSYSNDANKILEEAGQE